MGRKIEERELGDPRRLGLWVADPLLRLTVKESHIICKKLEEVSEWRFQVYQRAWNDIPRWDKIRAEYEDGPCKYFEVT